MTASAVFDPTAADIEAMVNPTPADLKVETEQLCRDGQWEQASQNVKRLMRMNDPEHGGYTQAQCHHALGDCAMNLGRNSIAITEYQHALQLDPSIRSARENLIFLIDSQAWTTEKQATRAREAWWAHHGAAAYAQRMPFTNTFDPEKRLRVGYVSSDFRFHSAVISFAPVVTDHTAQIETVLYSTLHPSLYDNTTKICFKDRFGPAFVDVSQHTPEAFAQIVRQDGIDILVDLSGYTAGNRLLSFAYKPAPIQITAWGYATGVGWRAMDALFADPIVATSQMRARSPERVIDLPCVIGFWPRPDLPAPNPLPCLNEGPLFGVFQRASKINDDTFKVWSAILKRVPESRILFKGVDYTPQRREWIVRQMSCPAYQITFEMGGSHFDHQHWYSAVDLSLDPWPQTGGVSSMESLWMGVPVLTLTGDRLMQRTTHSILHTLGLPEFVATTRKDYIAKAIELTTTKREWLNDIRLGLRDRMIASPIIAGYRDAVEGRYRELWREACATHEKEVAA